MSGSPTVVQVTDAKNVVSAKARDAFAGDLFDQEAAPIGATQRPVADSAFGEPNGPPASSARLRSEPARRSPSSSART
jgi:hypothetical protein